MSNVGQSQLCRNGISSPCVFSGLFYCYFKGINLLKKRELIFRSLNWTIIDVLGPEFDSWVPPWSYFGGRPYHKPIRLDSLANPVCPWDGKIQRWIFNTSVALYSILRPVLCSNPRQSLSLPGIRYQLGTSPDCLVHLQSQILQEKTNMFQRLRKQ